MLRRSAASEGVLVLFATDLHSMTMRRLLLFRHAKAERSHAGTEDKSRKLIDRGRADAAKVGSYMASHALLPDQVLTSPSARTRETWKFAGAAFRPPLAATQVEALYAASAHAILGLVKGTGPAIHTLLVIGHNPGLHELAVMLIASGDVEARERLKEKLPTSGLVIIDFAFDDWSRLHSQCGRLERFVTPKSLASAAN
jgi:phosphohistidine phosphatase